jgi:predicted phosphodiesterase
VKLGIISDIHTEVGKPTVDLRLQERVDVMILAGDIGKGIQAVQFAHDTYADMADAIVMIAGNHEYYGGTYQSVLENMRKWAAMLPNVYFLERDAVSINGVNFIGSTAWTDYRYGGGGQPLNMLRAHDLLNDHKRIKWNQHGTYRKLLARDCLALNAEAKQFIFKKLDEREGETNVVITHHAPTALSIHPRFEAAEDNFCYVNTWGNDIAYSSAKLWVHGHMHDPADYMVGDCRIVCNPMDYPEKARDRGPLIIEV